VFKKFVQSHFDRTEIVTRIGFQEAATGQRVNFSVAYVKRYAPQPVPSPLSVRRPHALGCGGPSHGWGGQLVRRHFWQPVFRSHATVTRPLSSC
jgi:hypothetical protein